MPPKRPPRKAPKRNTTGDPTDPRNPKGPPPKQPTAEARARGAAKRKARKPQRWTRRREDEYCEHLAEHGLPGKAARAIGTSKRNIKSRREAHPDFDRRCREAWEAYQERIKERMQEFAWDGKKEPIVHDGEVVAHRRVWFPTLTRLEAQRVCPEYRDPGRVTIVDESQKPAEQEGELQDMETEDLEAIELIIRRRQKPTETDE